MRKGGDRRGNNRNRRARKVWLLATFDVDLGSDRARCHLGLSDDCLGVLDYATVTADRIVRDGAYTRDNTQPACAPCQHTQGGLAKAGRLTAEGLLAGLRETREADQRKRFAELLALGGIDA